MKIACLLGSPRKNSNSSIIAKYFCSEAERLGAKVQTFTLNDLEYRGCQACMACKTKLDKCVLQDDLDEILETVRESEVLVLASPIYYGQITSQLKGFIDRTFSYLVPDYLTNPKKSRLTQGKTLVFILAQGNPEEKNFADVFPGYERFFKMHGFGRCEVIRACGVREAGEVSGRNEVLALAEKTAQQLFN